MDVDGGTQAAGGQVQGQAPNASQATSQPSLADLPAPWLAELPSHVRALALALDAAGAGAAAAAAPPAADGGAAYETQSQSLWR